MFIIKCMVQQVYSRDRRVKILTIYSKRFGRKEFSHYDYGAEFSIDMGRNYTLSLIKQFCSFNRVQTMQQNIFKPHPVFDKYEPLEFGLICSCLFKANKYGFVCYMNTEQCRHMDCLFFVFLSLF